MANRSGLLAQIWRGVRQSFHIARVKERFVGEDHLGNRYYEVIKDASKGIRGSRFVKGITDDDFDVPQVPHEWSAWLRKNRDKPPTQEEIDLNHAIAMHKQMKGRELEQKKEEESLQEAADGLIHKMKKDTEKEKKKFPVYSEYEEFPGDENNRPDAKR